MDSDMKGCEPLDLWPVFLKIKWKCIILGFMYTDMHTVINYIFIALFLNCSDHICGVNYCAASVIILGRMTCIITWYADVMLLQLYVAYYGRGQGTEVLLSHGLYALKGNEPHFYTMFIYILKTSICLKFKTVFYSDTFFYFNPHIYIYIISLSRKLTQSPIVLMKSLWHALVKMSNGFNATAPSVRVYTAQFRTAVFSTCSFKW